MYADTCYMIYMFIRGHLALITDDPLHAETLAMHPKCKHMTDLCSLDGVDYMIKDWTWLMLSRFASCGLETMPRGSGKLLNLSLSRIWLQFWKLRWTPLRSLGTGTEKFFFHKWPYKYTNIIHMYVMCHRFWKFSLGWIVCSSTMIQLWANDFRNRVRHQSTGCSYVRSNTLFWEVNIFEHVRVDRKGEGSKLVSRCGPLDERKRGSFPYLGSQ